MAWNVTKDWSYTTTSGATLALPVIDFATNYVEKTDKGDGLTFADTTAPIDRPALTHVEFHPRTNIYQNTGIDRAYWAPSVRGFNIYVQQMNTYLVSDGTETFYAPISCGISIKSLAHEAITPELVEEHLAYSIAQLHKKGVCDATRIAALMRGSLDLTK